MYVNAISTVLKDDGSSGCGESAGSLVFPLICWELSDGFWKRSNCLTITVGSKELHLWRLRLELVEWANRLPWWRSPCLQSPESWWAQVWKMILGGLFVSSTCGYVYPNPEPNAQPCRFVMCFGTPFSSPRLDWQKYTKKEPRGIGIAMSYVAFQTHTTSTEWVHNMIYIYICDNTCII